MRELWRVRDQQVHMVVIGLPRHHLAVGVLADAGHGGLRALTHAHSGNRATAILRRQDKMHIQSVDDVPTCAKRSVV